MGWGWGVGGARSTGNSISGKKAPKNGAWQHVQNPRCAQHGVRGSPNMPAWNPRILPPCLCPSCAPAFPLHLSDSTPLTTGQSPPPPNSRPSHLTKPLLSPCSPSSWHAPPSGHPVRPAEPVSGRPGTCPIPRASLAPRTGPGVHTNAY